MRIRSRGAAALLSLLLLGALALAACGSVPPTGSSDAESHGGSVTLVPSPKGPWVENFNPLTSGNTSLPGTQGMIYEPLLYFNRLDSSIQPWLASSYQWAGDGTSVTFTLRP